MQEAKKTTVPTLKGNVTESYSDEREKTRAGRYFGRADIHNQYWIDQY